MLVQQRNRGKHDNFEQPLTMGAGWRTGAMERNSTGPREPEAECIQHGCLENVNEELLNVAEEQHQQSGACAQSSNTDSESKVEKLEVVRPKTTTASVKIANISWQHAALLRKAVFNTVPGTVNVRRGAVAQTFSITSSEEGKADILEDRVDQLLPVPDTSIVGGQKVWFRELL